MNTRVFCAAAGHSCCDSSRLQHFGARLRERKAAELPSLLFHDAVVDRRQELADTSEVTLRNLDFLGGLEIGVICIIIHSDSYMFSLH